MPTTSLTVGGFNQPAVARALIELPGNAEKGLSQRFLWLFPEPVYAEFDSLEPINTDFTDKIGKLCHKELLLCTHIRKQNNNKGSYSNTIVSIKVVKESHLKVTV